MTDITVRPGGLSAQRDPDARLTSQQIRAARALLRWSPHQLAAAARVGIATVFRAEAHDGVPAIQTRTLSAIQQVLEQAGVVFLYSGDVAPHGAGVWLGTAATSRSTGAPKRR